jgi:flagellar biosynthetic protein FlhB
MAGSGERTEKASKRKQDKARKEGQFPASKELLASLQFLTFVVLLAIGWSPFLKRMRGMARYFLTAAFHIQLTGSGISTLYRQSVGEAFMPLLWLGGGLTTVALAGQLGSTRLGFAFEKLAPDLKRLSPLQKIKSLPSQNFGSFFQALLFLPLLGLAVYTIASKNLSAYASLTREGLLPALSVVAGSFKDLLWKAAYLFLAIGALDYFRAYRRHAKSLKMSKQEVRDEAKETEGNPQIKGRIRKIQRDLARRNMMKEVSKATAVIVNPTHYSVAIRYDLDSMAAPRVLAKGKNYLARRIKEIAIENQIPIIENQPLAQALYASADVGQEIPPHLYRAVAEVLAYIFKLMNPRKN